MSHLTLGAKAMFSSEIQTDKISQWVYTIISVFKHLDFGVNGARPNSIFNVLIPKELM